MFHKKATLLLLSTLVTSFMWFPGFSNPQGTSLPSLVALKDSFCTNEPIDCYKPLPAVTKGKIYHFLLIGSSNIMGRAMPRPEDSIPDPQVISIDLGYGGWKNTIEPSMPGVTLAGKGPALAFGKRYAKLHNDRYIGLLCCGESGMGLGAWAAKKFGVSSAWGPVWGLDDSGNTNGVNMIDHTTSQGYHTWGGLIIMSIPFGGTSGAYEKTLLKVIDSVRTWLKEPDLAVVVPEPAPFEMQNLGTANGNVWLKVVHNLPNIVPHSAYIRTDDCKSLLESNEAGSTSGVDIATHFDYASNVKIGERFAEAFTELESTPITSKQSTQVKLSNNISQGRVIICIGNPQRVSIGKNVFIYDIRGRIVGSVNRKGVVPRGVFFLIPK